MGGGGGEPWWRQMEAWKQLSATLEEILVTARSRRWESDRGGEGRGGREVAEYGAKIDGPWYAGMETGDTQLGELYCVERLRQERDRGKGCDRVGPPGGYWVADKKVVEQVKEE